MNPLRKNMPALAGLLIALGLPFVTPALSTVVPLVKDSPILSNVAPWLAALLVLLIVRMWERQPLSSIGLRRLTWRDGAWGLAGFVIGVLTFIITSPLIRALHLTSTGSTVAQQLSRTPVLGGLFVALTAGVTEEIVYRGFLVERLTALSGRLSWGVAIAYAVFVLGHLRFWGLGGTIQIGVWALVVLPLLASKTLQ